MPGIKGRAFSGQRCDFGKKKGIKLRAQNLAKIRKEQEENLLASQTPKSKFKVEGRRVVDFEYMKNQMMCANKKCRKVMSLFDVSNEKVVGLASLFTFTCPECQTSREVRSSSYQVEDSHYNYDVNCKAAIGMIDAGKGATHVNAFLSALNIPTFHCSTLKRYERIVGKSIIKVAEQSFFEAALQEKELTLKLLAKDADDNLAGVRPIDESIVTDEPLDITPEFTSTPEPSTQTENVDFVAPTTSDSIDVNTPSPPFHPCASETERIYREKVDSFTSINASADMQWFKRGNGCRYDSLDGQCNLMGNETGKVMGVVIMMKDCSFCQKSKSGKCGRDTCNKNWSGSAKAMEPAATLQLVAQNKHLDMANVRVAELTGDEDSSTAARIRNNLGDAVVRSSDILHAKKCLSRQLYALQKVSSNLTPSAIKYILRCVSTSIAQSSANNPQALADALNSIPHHAFGVHTHCGSWCRAHKTPDYKSKYLLKPLGTPDCPLHHALVKIVKKFANKSPQLCKKRSSQKNESFNYNAITKAPKYIHYGSSDSLPFRVHAAAAQKNCDVEYVLLVNKELQLSPGVNTVKAREALKRKRQREKEEKKKPENKRRRMQGQEKRNQQTTTMERKEGTTYQSGMGFEEAVEEPIAKVTKRCLTFTASPLSKLPHVTETEGDIIYFDLETTGKSYKTCEIIQIAARSETSEFNIFIKPVLLTVIPEVIVDLTGISYQHGKMFNNNQFVPSVFARNGLIEFFDFLALHKNPILAAHNVTFDLRFILSFAIKHNLQERFSSVVSGAVDTCSLFKSIYKKKEQGPPNFSLSTMASFVLGPNFKFKAHSADHDVIAMKSVCDKLQVNTFASLVPSSFTIMSYIERAKGFKMFDSLVELTTNSNFPPRVLSKLARSGWDAAAVKTLVVEGTLENTSSILRNVLKKDTDETVKWLHCNIK